jgi:hypothetical protein
MTSDPERKAMCWRDIVKHMQQVNLERAKRALKEKEREPLCDVSRGAEEG